MKVVQPDEAAFARVFPNHRGEQQGPPTTKPLLYGERGALDNFALIEVRASGRLGSPRHRHNFEQFRFALLGPCNFAPGKDIPEGCLGYFPEGTFYGPFKKEAGCENLSLQFGGPSGYGFDAYADWVLGAARLEQRGVFENGTYEPASATGTPSKVRQDAFEAIWEELRGRPIEYPTPRFDAPVVINPEAFPWIPVASCSGVSLRELGIYHECGTRARMLQIEPGAAVLLTSSPYLRILYLLTGVVEIDGLRCVRRTAVQLDKHVDSCVVVGVEKATCLVFTLPRLDDDGKVRVLGDDLSAPPR